jgi:hypothetical protein
VRKTTRTKPASPAKHEKPARDISADGQVELRGNEILIYEPLKSEVEQICQREGITVQRFWDEICAPALRKELDSIKSARKGKVSRDGKSNRAK